MIRILSSFAFFMCFQLLGIAQEIEKQYINEHFEMSDEGEASDFYREVKVSESGLWMVSIYYNPSGKLKMTGSYSDESLELEEGEFTYYYRNGNIESRGMCSEGIKFGIWERYLWDGTRREDRYYSGATVDDYINSNHRSTSASFPGGEAAMYNYLKGNMQYPEPAMLNSIEGTVEVSFAISQNGKIINPSITKSANYYLDKEAERLVANMPTWEAAMKAGNHVQSNFVLPIEFKLPE